MFEPKEITIQLVKSGVVIDRLADVLDDIKAGYLCGDAHEYFLALRKVLAHPVLAKDERIQSQYAEVLLWLGFFSLPFRSEPEIMVLLQNHLLFAIRHDIDVLELIRRYLGLYQDEISGGELMRKAIEAIGRNEEVLGEPLMNSDDKSRPPTVSNWIKKLLSQYPANHPISNIEEIQFFSREAQLLRHPEVREVLQKVFIIYNTLRFPQVRQPVISREEEPVREMAPAPVTVRAIPEVRPSDPISSLKNKYAEYRVNRQRILDLEDKVLVASKGDPHAIYHELSGAVQGGDKFRAIACLKLLARQQALAESLKANPAWWEATAEYITKKYTGQFPVPEVKLAVSDLKYNPTSPEVISEFLQFILGNRLRISGSESALIGVEIGQLTGGEFQSMAYGNAETGEFEWVKNKIADRKLISEM
jgi:hypothetical protein